MVPLAALLAVATALGSAPHAPEPAMAEELRIRDGMPNAFAKLREDKTVRVAYVGGSITAAEGWRPKTLAWLRARYPKTTVEEINAAISGTGSDYAACRLASDVLSRKPDLVFVEFRVNGGGGFERQSIEGVVRQIWQQSPRTDICFVYTICQWMLPELSDGKQVAFEQVMETVANCYGIPTIDLGVEIARREKEGSLVFKGDQPVEGKLVFTADGVHPGDAGHAIYRDVIARSLLRMEKVGKPHAHTLPDPMGPGIWDRACLLSLSGAKLAGGWEPVDTESDPVYNDDKGRTHAMLRGAVRCNHPGATITVTWTGTTVGISDIPYGEPCVIEAVVDGGAPITIRRVQTEAIHKYARFWYLPEQKPGTHTAVFTVKEVPAGEWFYAGQLLIVGKPGTARP